MERELNYFLIDTNIWLELLLSQERAKEVENFFMKINTNYLYITDFTFHSICIIMIRFNRFDELIEFINDLFINGRVNLINLSPDDTGIVLDAIKKYNLDFDDAYQYISAKLNNLELISFDKHFEKTDLGYKTPSQVKI